MSKTARILIAVVIVMGGLRLALPMAIKWKANKTLQELPNYKGHIDGVHLAIWRGACVLKDIEIMHKEGDFGLAIKRLSLNASWRHLFQKKWVGNIRIDSPRLRVLVRKPGEAPEEGVDKAKDLNRDVKRKTGKSLPDLLATLIPFRIDEFRLTDGTIRLQDRTVSADALVEKDKETAKDSRKGREAERDLEARVSHLEIEAHNLTNRAQLSSSTFADARVSAQVMERGKFKLDLKLDPNAESPTFDMNAELTELHLIELNPLFRWQWGVDVKKGLFAMFAEAAAKDGRFRGYVKPFIKDIEFHDSKQDKNKSVGKKVKEAIADVAAAILKNPDTKSIATRVPFEGQFENPQAGIWESVIAVLRNAFVKALSPHLDRSI